MSFLGWGKKDNAVRNLTYNTYQLPGSDQQSEQKVFNNIGTNMGALFADPEAQQYIQTLQRNGVDSKVGKAAKKQLDNRAKQLGAKLPPHSDWAVNSQGQLGYQQADINNDYIYPIATLAAAGGMGLGAASAFGAFGAGAGGAGSTGALPTGVGLGTGGVGTTGAAAPAYLSVGVGSGTTGGAAATGTGATIGSVGGFGAAPFGASTLPAVAGGSAASGGAVAGGGALAGGAGGAAGSGGIMSSIMGTGAGGGMGSTAMNMGGAALQAYGQYKASKEQAKMDAAMAQMQDSLSRDQSLAVAAPTGWAQNYQQGTLLKQLMMQKLMGPSNFTPSNPDLASRLGNIQRPSMPADWQQVDPFSVQQTMASLANRQGVLDKLSNGAGPAIQFSQFGQPNPQLQQQTDQYRGFVNQDRQRLLEAIGLSKRAKLPNPVAGQTTLNFNRPQGTPNPYTGGY